MSSAIAARGTQLQRVTTTIGEVLKIDQSGKKADLADVTNMDSPSAFKEFLPTLLDSGEVKFEVNFLPANTSQADCLADFNGQVLSAWKIVLPATAGHWDFSAYVTGYDVAMDITKQVTGSITLKITGPVTYTAGS
jgi:predicted secreted protein